MPGLDHNNWAVKAVTNAYQSMQRTPGVRGKGWGDAALHHQISKVALERIGTDLEQAMQSRDQDLANAAKTFWKAVQQATPKEIRDQAGQAATRS